MSEPATLERVLVPIAFCDPEDDPDGVVLEVGQTPVSVSRASVQALSLAATIAPASGEIRLLHATPAFEQGRVYSGAARSSLLGGALDDVQREAITHSTATLDAIAARWCPEANTSSSARAGNPLNVILAENESFGAHLIVIATSSRGAVARFFLGSTADRVIREAPCPVLVVPAGT